MRPISGRFAAAATNFCAWSARNCGVWPERSWRTKVNPAPVPRPGIAGGPNANTVASGMVMANSRLSVAMIPFELSAAPLRSPHSLSDTKKKALFDA